MLEEKRRQGERETENRNEREMEERMREWRTDFSPNTYICKIRK